MATIAEMSVRIGADISDFEKNLESIGTSLKRTGEKLTSIGMSLSMAITAPLAGIGIATTKMAMDAIESENLFEVAMGDMADAARAWSEDLRNQLGLNAYEVRRNVGIFNQMLTAMGMGKDASFDMSKGLTQLGYDMASFFNLKPEEAFQKLQAGITGETEPLRRLGIMVNETTIKTYAYTNGIAKQGSELTEQQKILARYGVIMEQTKIIQGDLKRTLDSPTNQLRIMGEQVKNLSIDFGMVLIPILQKLINNVARPLLGALKAAVDWFKTLSPEVQQAIVVFAGVVATIGPAVLIIGTLISVLGSLLNPLGLVVLAIGGLVTAGILLYQNWDKIAYYAEQTWNYILLTILSVIEGILEGMARFTGWIPGWGDKIRSAEKYVEDLRAGVEKHMNEMQKPWEKSGKAVEKSKKQFSELSKVGTASAKDISDSSEDMEKKVSTIMAELDRNLKTNQVLSASLGDEYKKNAKDMDVYKKAISSLIEAGLDPADGKVMALSMRLRELSQDTDEERAAIDDLCFVLDEAFQKELDESAEAVAELNRMIEYLPTVGEQADKILIELSNSLEINQRLALALGDEFDATRAKTDLIRQAIENLVKQGVDPSSKSIETLKGQLEDLKIKGAFHVEKFSSFVVDEFIKIKDAIEKNLSSALADAIMGKDVNWKTLWESTLKLVLQDIIEYLIQIALKALAVKAALKSMFAVDLGAGAGAGLGAGAGAAAGAGAGGALATISGPAILGFTIPEIAALAGIGKLTYESWRWLLGGEDPAQTIVRFVEDTVDTVAETTKDAADWLFDDVLGIAEWFQHGGIITRPTLAGLGEAGPEAVIPLDRLGDYLGNGQQTIIIELDGRQIAKKTVQHMPSILRLQGVPV